MGSLSDTCYLAALTFPPLLQPKLVLDLTILEGCKAELTWVMVISQDSLPVIYQVVLAISNYGHYIQWDVIPQELAYFEQSTEPAIIPPRSIATVSLSYYINIQNYGLRCA